MIENHGLMKICEPHLVKRYNEALYKLCGFKTRLQEFYIDCSGFSPQIAEEIEDIQYLNVNGVNKTFIIISTSQKDLEMYNNHFSSNKFVIKSFIESNFKTILALTSMDVIYGEIENNVLKVNKIDDVLSSNRVRVFIDTPKKIIKKSKELLELIESVKNSDDYVWSDNKDLEKIIELSSQVGDVRKNPISISNDRYKKKAFYTSHFGGLYVFYNDSNEPSTILFEKKSEIENEDIPNEIKVIDANDRVAVFDFLSKTNLIKKMGFEVIISKSKFINSMKKNILIDYMVESGDFKYPDDIDEYDMKNFIKRNYDNLSSVFKQFYELSNSVKNNEYFSILDEEVIFYLCEPSDEISGNALNIVEHIIAKQTPYSYLNSFLNNRDEFWKNYKTWSSEKQEYVRALIMSNI